MLRAKIIRIMKYICLQLDGMCRLYDATDWHGKEILNIDERTVNNYFMMPAGGFRAVVAKWIIKQTQHMQITPEQAKELSAFNERPTDENAIDEYAKAMQRGDWTIPLGTCGNCNHWRDKLWTTKGWGACDNPKNEVMCNMHYHMRGIVSEELIQKLEEMDCIRYPEDFGCIYFEPKR